MSFMTMLSKLNVRQRIALIASVITTLISIAAIAFLSNRTEMALLYGDLDPTEAGEIILALEKDGIPYDAKGGALLVPRTDRDRLRMILAEKGLPGRGNQAGYELLDNIDGFSTTAEMFDAALWRAREGEIARTIATLPTVASVRVHLSPPAATVFGRRATDGAKASITLSLRRPGSLTKAQIYAIQHLTALAIPGLAREDVTVVDLEQGILSTDANDNWVDRSYEQRLSDDLKAMVGARVGGEAVRVSVSIDREQQSQTIRERVFDPRSRSMISTETIERSSTGGSSAPVTVDGNLPGDGPDNGNQNSASSETIERQNYEVSETVRETVRQAGGIARMSVAVLVDDVLVQAPDGTSSRTPRSAEELAALEELVKGAVGFNAARGDVVTVRSLAFADRPVPLGSGPSQRGWFEALSDQAGSLAQIALLGVIVALIGLFVIRPVVAAARATETDALFAEQSLSLPSPAEESESEDETENQIGELRRLARERPHQAAQLIETWLVGANSATETER
jgi:flagellar M-ring protein FliF